MAPLRSPRLASGATLVALALAATCVASRLDAASLPELSPPPASTRFT